MPTVPGPPGRLAPWRAAARIARRDASRHRGRSTLVAVLVATPVLLLSTVSVVWRSDDLDPQDLVTLRLGTAGQAAVALDGLGRGAVTQDIQGMVTSQSGDGAGYTARFELVVSGLGGDQGEQLLEQAQALCPFTKALDADRLTVRLA